ncbi:MAG: hypothetical protein WCK47_00300 [bacterium]|nr:hypothetical protein [Candidatus Sumerlaeota bacterium]
MTAMVGMIGNMLFVKRLSFGAQQQYALFQLTGDFANVFPSDMFRPRGNQVRASRAQWQPGR